MCMENGKVKYERQKWSWSEPQNLLAIVLMIGMGLTVVWNLYAYEGRIFDSAEQKYETINFVKKDFTFDDSEKSKVMDHIEDTNVHMPLQVKEEHFVTRREFEQTLKTLESIDKKIDILLKKTGN